MPRSISFLLFFLCCAALKMKAQCPEGIIHLSSDEEITAFVKAYPNCTSLDSSLIIGPKEDMASTRITDVTPLSKITIVNGDFILNSNPWLIDVGPITKLEVVKGNVELGLSKDMKPGIVNLGLLRIDGDLKMILQEYEGKCRLVFRDLIKIGGQITIHSHEIHHVMFPSLWKLGHGIWNYSGYAHFVEGEFPNLETVGGRIELNDFKDDGNVILPQLRHVGSLDIPKTKNKIYMGQLKSCKSVTIQGHNRVIRALEDLESLETLRIRGANNEVLKSFKNLAEVKLLDLQAYDDTLAIENMPSLKKAEEVVLHGGVFTPLVKAIDTITGSISARKFHSSKLLNDLRASYDSIKLHISYGQFDQWDLCIKGKLTNLTVEECPSIKNMQGLDLSDVTITKMYIRRNESLEDISSLELDPERIERISLVNNPNLKSCHSDWVCKLLEIDRARVELKRNHESCSKSALKKQCN